MTVYNLESTANPYILDPENKSAGFSVFLIFTLTWQLNLLLLDYN